MKLVYKFNFEVTAQGESSPSAYEIQGEGSTVSEAFQSALNSAGLSVNGMTGDVSYETVGYTPTITPIQ